MDAPDPGADLQARQDAAERVRALRSLLERPLMHGSDPGFTHVRRHAGALREWLTRETGWALHVERDCARLYKRPADLMDATRGLPGFDRRRYVLLCLALAVLERADPQVTLHTLGERLLTLAADPQLAACGFEFRLERAHERRDLVHVCRFLLDLGVLARVAGDEESYVQRAGDALYDVRRRVLAAVFAGARGPSSFSPESAPHDLDMRLHALADPLEADGPQAQRTFERHRLARRMLDDPVVYADELPGPAREYFVNQRGAMAARIAEAAGLHPEQRAEGVALVDPEGELGDAQLPAEGTDAHATLLAAEYLAARLEAGDAGAVPHSALAAHLRAAGERYARYWRKQAREPGAEHELADIAAARLEALKLVERLDGAVRPRPALARFAFRAPELRERTLFER